MKHVIGCTTRPYTSLALAEACRHIADAGFSDVAVFPHEGGVPVRSETAAHQVKECRNQAVDAGLAPSMVMAKAGLNRGLEAAVDDYKRLIDNTRELGATWLLECGTSKSDQYEDFVTLMRCAAPHAADAGVTITLKPHGGIALTGRELSGLCRKVDHPAFTVCYDPGNIIYYTVGEQRPEADVSDTASDVTTFIIKDCRVQNGQANVMVTPGQGLVDFEDVLGQLVGAGFDGPLYLECVGGQMLDEINDDVRRSREFIQKILARIYESKTR